MEQDPVCGMLVDPKQAAGQRTYRGKIYHFCSADCMGKFDKAPERYAAKEQENKTDPRDK